MDCYFLFYGTLGNSPLHFAVQSSDRHNIARLLIENGAALNAVNKSGATPMESAIDNGYYNKQSNLIDL